MDAARDFACGVEARNDLAFPVKGMGLDVGVDAAHRVMDRHAGVAGPEGTVLNALGEVDRTRAPQASHLMTWTTHPMPRQSTLADQ